LACRNLQELKVASPESVNAYDLLRFRRLIATREAMGRLGDALEPGTVLLVASYYNPFNFGTGLVFETVAQQTVDKLNAAVVRVAEESGATVAEVGSLFGDLAFGITHISEGDVHPNDLGYGVMARAFEDAYEVAALGG